MFQTITNKYFENFVLLGNLSDKAPNSKIIQKFVLFFWNSPAKYWFVVKYIIFYLFLIIWQHKIWIANFTFSFRLAKRLRKPCKLNSSYCSNRLAHKDHVYCEECLDGSSNRNQNVITIFKTENIFSLFLNTMMINNAASK